MHFQDYWGTAKTVAKSLPELCRAQAAFARQAEAWWAQKAEG